MMEGETRLRPRLALMLVRRNKVEEVGLRRQAEGGVLKLILMSQNLSVWLRQCQLNRMSLIKRFLMLFTSYNLKYNLLWPIEPISHFVEDNPFL